MTTPVLAIIETSIGSHGREPLRIARELGLRPVLFTANPARYPLHSTDETEVCDTTDEHAVLAALDRVDGPLAGIYSFTDYAVPMAATLAAHRGLPGLNPAVARLARDKATTQLRLQQAAVPCAQHVDAHNLTEAMEGAERIGYPVVVKPRAEAGSIGVVLCDDPTALRTAAERELGRSHDYRGRPISPSCLVEEFLVGSECSVEVIALNGRRLVVGVCDKFLGPMPHFIEIGHVFPSPMDADDRAAAIDTALAALDAIGYDFGAAHLEIKITANAAKIVEINPRIAGTPIPSIITAATDHDYLRTVISLHAGLLSPADIHDWPTPRRWAASHDFISPTGGTLRHVQGVTQAQQIPGIFEVSVHAEPGELRPAVDNTDWLATAKATGPSPYLAWRHAEVAASLLRIDWAS